MSEVIIKVDQLKKTYKSGLFRKRYVHALKGVSFEVKKGEMFGLVGPNGAGKTTCIKVLLGIVSKSDGNATVFGEPAGAINSRRRIGYLPEHHRIPTHHTANSAMKFYGSLCGMDSIEISTRSVELLKAVGLGDWGDHPIKKFSKGMQQRLGLAQAMLNRPDLLILDEPTDGVDPKGRAEIREILKKLQSEGVTIFINSHLLQEMELLCDNIIIFEKGEVIHASTIAEITNSNTKTVRFRVEASANVIKKAFESEITLKDVNLTFAATPPNVTSLSFTIDNADQVILNKSIDTMRRADISIMEMRNDNKTLEQAFLDIVKGGNK